MLASIIADIFRRKYWENAFRKVKIAFLKEFETGMVISLNKGFENNGK